MHILFDIGGTKMRIASTMDGRSFDNVHIEKTKADNFDEGMKQFEEMVLEIAKGEKVKGIVGGIAGPLNKEKSMLSNSPNIKGWIGKPLKDMLVSFFDAPVRIENDAELVGLGEALYGAGKGFQNVAYITVSTGVGGGRIVNGKIEEGSSGFEPGHQIIQYGDTKCPGCGGDGDLESFISGNALRKRTGKDPRLISQNDPVWEELARIFAVGLHNVSIFWAPDLMVLGGSMIVGSPAIPVERVEKHLTQIMKIYPTPPPIRKAVLKDEGGLYGALALVKQYFLRT